MVAIDGPAGAGKSTVAARVAARFGLLNLESGAMYRAFALKAIQTDSDIDDREELGRLALKTRIRLLPAALGNRVFLDDVEVTKRIREADVTAAASRVSVHPGIRQWMVSMQRQLGADRGVVMEEEISAPRSSLTPRSRFFSMQRPKCAASAAISRMARTRPQPLNPCCRSCGSATGATAPGPNPRFSPRPTR